MKDKQKLDALLRDVKPAEASLQRMLSEMAAREGLYTGNGHSEHIGLDRTPSLDEPEAIVCPSCGAVFKS